MFDYIALLLHATLLSDYSLHWFSLSIFDCTSTTVIVFTAVLSNDVSVKVSTLLSPSSFLLCLLWVWSQLSFHLIVCHLWSVAFPQTAHSCTLSLLLFVLPFYYLIDYGIGIMSEVQYFPVPLFNTFLCLSNYCCPYDYCISLRRSFPFSISASLPIVADIALDTQLHIAVLFQGLYSFPTLHPSWKTRSLLAWCYHWRCSAAPLAYSLLIPSLFVTAPSALVLALFSPAIALCATASAYFVFAFGWQQSPHYVLRFSAFPALS